MSTNAIFVVAQRGFSAQVKIKIGIRRDEKIRFARTNSSSATLRKVEVIAGTVLLCSYTLEDFYSITFHYH